MPRTLQLIYADAADLAAHLAQHQAQQAVMIPLPPDGEPPKQFERLSLSLEIGAAAAAVEAEALQLLGPSGLVVRLLDPAPAAALVGDTTPSQDASAPLCCWAPDAPAAGAPSAPEEDPVDAPPEDGPAPVKGHQLPPGMGPKSWPIEKLRQEWENLSQPQKIQVARHGKKAARRMIMKKNDKQLVHHVMLNPHISVDEVAALANNPGLDPDLVRRIANSPEWTRHASIARNLVCHPKLPLPVVTRIVERLRAQDLRRLVRSGRLRAAVKRIVVKKLDRSRI